MPFYAYMIQSESTGKHYYGHTSDLPERMKSHNSTQNRYTRGEGPWNLVGFTEAEAKTEAIQLEIKLKNMKNPGRVLNWLQKHGNVG